MSLAVTSCRNSSPTLPKPRMYPRIFYPETGSYSVFDTTFCNFSFKYPEYAEIIQDSFFYGDFPLHPCWFDINIPSLNASLYCSYYKADKEKSLPELINDAFTITEKHNIKANYRKETLIDNNSDVQGLLFDIEGPVASPTQFYLTDGKENFFRASLYFNSKVDPDSTAAVLQFIKPELDTLIASFRWK